MGEKEKQGFQLTFNGLLKVDFQVTSDGGLILVRELDERLGLGKQARVPLYLGNIGGQIMHLRRLIPAAFMLCISGPAPAQGWIEFPSEQDLFGVNFPGEPKVEETTWASQFEATFPARVYSVEKGQSRFSVTVVDYRDAERIHTEQAKDCPPGAETCLGGPGITGVGYWKHDVQGSMVYAARRYLQRDADMTNFLWNTLDQVEGLQLYLTNPDKSRTFVAIYLHKDRLYILDATAPQGVLGVEIFQQSLRFIDEEGETVRYQRLYHNSAPPPPRVGAGSPANAGQAGQ